MLLTYNVRSGDILVEVPVTVNKGEEFREGTTRYRVEGLETDAVSGEDRVVCRLVEGTHPFWWADMADGDRVLLPGDFLARTLHEKRAFGMSSAKL